MGLVSFPSIINFNRTTISTSLFLSSQHISNLHKLSPHDNSMVLQQPIIQQKISLKNISLYPVKLNVTSSGSSSSSSSSEEEDKEEESKALETMFKLYPATKDRNIFELSDILSDKRRCISNFIFSSQPFQGKKQVVEFFSHLMRWMGRHVEFVIKLTLHNGMNIGIAWRLEWGKTHVPLGKGISFYISQVYQGKVLIRNVETFKDPLLQMGPFRLKLIGWFMNLIEILSFQKMTRDNIKRALYTLLILFFIAIILFFTKPGMY